MAASIMFSRFAGSSCFKRVIGRSISTCFAVRLSSSLKNSHACSFNAYLRAPVVYRCNATSTAATVAPAREKRAVPDNVTNKAIETGDAVTVQLSALDDQVRRTERLEFNKVQQILDMVVKNGTATTQQGVMLLHCSGSLLVASTRAERIVLCNKICETLQKAGVDFNIQMYNALLKAKLENGQPFSPVDMLTEIEVTKQLVPNRVTYQLLLSQFCEEGNLEGASKVLEHMKSQGILLNENVFNSLVKCHIVKGNIPEAREVMANMGKAGLDPTGSTYTVLMCGLADRGDIAGIKEILAEINNGDVYISPSNVYSVILSLANKGHYQHIPEMVDYIRSRFRPGKYNHATLNCVYQLVTGGHDDAAFTVFSMFDFRNGYADSEGTIRLSHNLLRCMIARGRPVDKILEIYDKLKSENLAGEDSLEFIAFVAMKSQRADYALEVVNKVKSLGVNVKPHFFWPMLNSEARHSNVDGVLNVIRQMTSASETGLSVAAVYRWGIKSLINGGQKIEPILQKLKEVGFNEEELQIIHTASLISSGNFSEAVKLIDNGAKYSISVLKFEIVDGFAKSGYDVSGLVKLLQSCEGQRAVGSLNDLYLSVLLGSIKQRQLGLDVVQRLVDTWTEQGVKLSSSSKQLVRIALQARNASKELIQKLDRLFVGSQQVEERSQVYNPEDLKTASLEDLQSWLAKAKADGRQTQKLEKWLLHKCCYEGNVEQAEAVKASLIGSGFTFKEESLRQLGVLAARDKQNLDEALHYKKELESRHPSFGGYVNLVLFIAQLQLAGGKFEEAKATLKEYASRHRDFLQTQGFADGYMMSDIASKMVQTCCEHNDFDHSVQLLDLLFESGYVKSGAFNLLSQLVNSYINKSDAIGAMSALEHCVTRYHKAPQYSAIFRFLITKEDASLLQKAVDLVTSVEGELNVLLNLSACFVECGKGKQARKILETPGLRAQMVALKDSCQRFIAIDKEKELEQFVEITKSLPGISRGQMLLQLIRFHARKKNPKKILEAFSLFEEEHIVPDKGVLIYVAKALQSLQHPVPFEIPQELLIKQAVEVKDEGKLVEELSSAKIQMKPTESKTESIDATKVLELKAQLSGDEFVTFITNAVNKMLKRNEREALRRFIYQLSQAGDIESLMVIQKLLPKSMDIYLHQQLLLAHIQQNTADQVLNSLTENILDVRKYLSVGALKLMAEKNPDQAAKFEKLATDCAEKSNNPVVVGYLYSYYILNNQWDSVKQLLQKFDTLKSKIRQAYVCRLAKQRKQEDTFEKMIDLHRNDDKRALIMPYSNLLLLKCEQGNWSDAINCYNNAVSSGLMFDDIWVRSLQALQSLAQANKQTVPWQAGSLEKRAAEDAEIRRKRRFGDSSSSSSSSDSSDSDKEGSDQKK